MRSELKHILVVIVAIMLFCNSAAFAAADLAKVVQIQTNTGNYFLDLGYVPALQTADGTIYAASVGTGTTNVTIGGIVAIEKTGNTALLHAFPEYTGTSSLIQGQDGNLYGVGGGGRNSIYSLSPQGDYTILYDGATSVDYIAGYPLIDGGDGYFYGLSVSMNGNEEKLFRISPSGSYAVMAYWNRSSYNVSGQIAKGLDGNFYAMGLTASGNTAAGAFFQIAITQSATDPIHVVSTFARPKFDTIFTGLITGGDGAFYGTFYSSSTGESTLIRFTSGGASTILAGAGGGSYFSLPIDGADGYLYFGNKQRIWRVSYGGSFQMLYSYPNVGIYTDVALFRGNDGSILSFISNRDGLFLCRLNLHTGIIVTNGNFNSENQFEIHGTFTDAKQAGIQGVTVQAIDSLTQQIKTSTNPTDVNGAFDIVWQDDETASNRPGAYAVELMADDTHYLVSLNKASTSDQIIATIAPGLGVLLGALGDPATSPLITSLERTFLRKDCSALPWSSELFPSNSDIISVGMYVAQNAGYWLSGSGSDAIGVTGGDTFGFATILGNYPLDSNVIYASNSYVQYSNSDAFFSGLGPTHDRAVATALSIIDQANLSDVDKIAAKTLVQQSGVAIACAAFDAGGGIDFSPLSASGFVASAAKVSILTDPSTGVVNGVQMAGSGEPGEQSVALAFAPVPSVGSATASLTCTEATVICTIDTHGVPGTYYFNFGETSDYMIFPNPVSIPAGSGVIQATLRLVGLKPSTTYHYQIVVNTAGGGYSGPDQTFTTGIFVDSDGDGIPDCYEINHGMDSHDPTDAQKDFDGDGQTNLQEYLAGTDPNDPNSLLRISSISVNLPYVMVYFPTVLGKQYVLEATDSLFQPVWTGVTGYDEWTPVLGNGGTCEAVDFLWENPPTKFYRVRVLP